METMDLLINNKDSDSKKLIIHSINDWGSQVNLIHFIILGGFVLIIVYKKLKNRDLYIVFCFIFL